MPGTMGRMAGELEGRDTRRQGRRILSKEVFSPPAAVVKTLACAALAAGLVFGVDAAGWGWYEGLGDAGLWMLAILVFASGLWISEALPAFVVAVLVIALEIAVLGRPGGVFAAEDETEVWLRFVAPWSSSIMWLFLGGFVMAQAAVNTGLDGMCARRVLAWCKGRPVAILGGVMGVTFCFSMFMSNTATAAMMMVVLAPLIRLLPKDDKFPTGLLLGVAMAANVGGIATVIGTPANAIAVGILGELAGVRVGFLEWMVIGLPVALVLGGAAYLYLLKSYPCGLSLLPLDEMAEPERDEETLRPRWHRGWVMAVFAVTVLLWMTGAVHGMSPPVVSFFAITVLTISGVIGAEDVRRLPWDVLLLLAGGLALGEGIQATGVATWLPGLLPEAMPPLALALTAIYLAVAMSNVMSNTAAAAILLPIAVSLAEGTVGVHALALAAPIAIACSVGMCLPVSTPPNAIVYASGRLATRHFIRAGLWLGLAGPMVGYLWVRVVG